MVLSSLIAEESIVENGYVVKEIIICPFCTEECDEDNCTCGWIKEEYNE